MIIFRNKLFATVNTSKNGTLSPSQSAANQRAQMAMQRTNMVTQRFQQGESMKQQRLNMTMMRMTQQNNLHDARAKQRQSMQNQRLAIQRQLSAERNLARLKSAEKQVTAKNIQLFKRPATAVPPVPMKI